jgi:signal transduction histidine kinase
MDGLAFTTEDQQVIEMLAAYAAVAISNARLYQELTHHDQVLTRRNENLALLNEIAVTLASSSDIDQILDKALTHLMDFLHLEVGEIFLRLEDSKILQLVLHRGANVPNLWEKNQYEDGEGIIGTTSSLGQPQLLPLPGITVKGLTTEALASNFQQIACFPLTGRSKTLGVLSVATSHAQPFNEMEMQFLTAISSWVGTVIENMRLNLQGRRLAVLEERERIGMDLHDGIIQSIYAVGLTLEHARLLLNEDPQQARQRIEQCINDLNTTIRDIRAYILDLRPRQLHNESLMLGLQRLVTEFRANTLMETHLHGPNEGLDALSPTQAITLFHICQEALANIGKHSHAHHVEVSLFTSPERVLLEVRDDGKGFDVGQMTATIGHGLANMLTRARSSGGDVEITSEPNSGTSVLAWVPFKKD